MKSISVKKITSICISVMLVISCTACTIIDKSMLNSIDKGDECEIKPVYNGQGSIGGTVQENTWIELDQLTSADSIRTRMDKLFKVFYFDVSHKNGPMYITENGDWTGNSCLRNAIFNKYFVQTMTDADNLRVIQESVNEYYEDDAANVSTAMLYFINSYFNIISDTVKDNKIYFDANRELTRQEFMAAISKAETEVKYKGFNPEFINSVEFTDYTYLDSIVADYSYLNYKYDNSTGEDGSLTTKSLGQVITRAEAIYLVVNMFFNDELQNTGSNDTSYKDVKNGGKIAYSQQYINKDNETNEVSYKKYWKAYQLQYCIKENNGEVPDEIYKALATSYKIGLLSSNECRWNEPITKIEALDMIVTAYQLLIDKEDYKVNTAKGATNTESVEQQREKGEVVNEKDSEIKSESK